MENARVSDYGMTEYPGGGGFGRMPPPPAPVEPMRGGGGGSPAYLVTLLVIACVVVGVFLAWGVHERGERTRLTIRNKQVEDAYVFAVAKRNDLAGFLTDPRTRLYRLVGKGRGDGAVTIAWQAETGRGLLIGDRMPLPGDRERYAVWRLEGPEAVAALLGAFRPEAGGTFYEFSRRGEGSGGEGGFIVTRETELKPAVPGEVVYETR
jgi:hypothetical protein